MTYAKTMGTKMGSIDYTGMAFPKSQVKKERKKHPASIMQAPEDHDCYLCGCRGVHSHHIFGASNRTKSESYGLKVWLCWECHEGTYGVHNYEEANQYLKEEGQKAFEAVYGHQKFVKEFGKNYL